MSPSKQDRSLWPELPKAEIGPITLIRQQGDLLKKQTNELIQGYLLTLKSDPPTTHQFLLRAPALGGFLYELFTVTQVHTTPYPLTLTPDDPVAKEIIPKLTSPPFHCMGHAIRIENQEMLTRVLKLVFHASHTRKILQNLLDRLVA